MASSPESRPLGWGLIGPGHHADVFVAPGLRKASNSRLVAVASRDLERARAFALKHGAAHAYGTVDELLQNDEVDAVWVCSPNHMHLEQVLAGAAAGKHLLCEKPLSINVDECATMVDACHQAGVRLGTGFHLRHNPVHREMRDLVQRDVLGELTVVDIRYFHRTSGPTERADLPEWRKDPAIAGGGRFQGSGLHAVDLARYMSGRDFTHIEAMPDDSWARSGSEQFTNISARLDGGVTAAVLSGPVRHPLNTIALSGTLASIRAVDSIGNYGGGCLELRSDKGIETTRFEPSDVYAAQAEAFADAVREERTPSASGEDGLRVAQISRAVYRSFQNRAVVALDD